MKQTPIEAAEADWCAISVPSTRPWLDKKGRVVGTFRELDGIAVCIEWKAGAGWILMFARTTVEPSRSAITVLRKIQGISDLRGVPIRGNVAAIETEECPAPDLDRLIALYRRAGFGVGGPPTYLLCYPPRN